MYNSTYTSQHHIKDLKTIVSWCFRFWNHLLNNISRVGPEAAEVLDGEYIQHQCKDLQTMDGSMVLLVCRKTSQPFLVKNRSSGRKFHTLLSRVNPQRYVGNDMVLSSRCKLHMSWPYLPPSIFWQMLNLEHLPATKCDRKMSWCL